MNKRDGGDPADAEDASSAGRFCVSLMICMHEVVPLSTRFAELLVGPIWDLTDSYGDLTGEDLQSVLVLAQELDQKVAPEFVQSLKYDNEPFSKIAQQVCGALFRLRDSLGSFLNAASQGSASSWLTENDNDNRRRLESSILDLQARVERAYRHPVVWPKYMELLNRPPFGDAGPGALNHSSYFRPTPPDCDRENGAFEDGAGCKVPHRPHTIRGQLAEIAFRGRRLVETVDISRDLLLEDGEPGPFSEEFAGFHYYLVSLGWVYKPERFKVFSQAADVNVVTAIDQLRTSSKRIIDWLFRTGCGTNVAGRPIGITFVPEPPVGAWDDLKAALLSLIEILTALKMHPEYAQDDSLTQMEQEILQALLALGAFDANSRRNTSEVAKKAVGDGANPENYKRPIGQLRKKGFVHTKEGRGGGCWLSSSGKRVAESI